VIQVPIEVSVEKATRRLNDALCDVVEFLSARARELTDNLTATQARCTALVEENRELRAKLANVALPGWFCPGCGGWNGEAKERLDVCRGHGCGIPRSVATGEETAR